MVKVWCKYKIILLSIIHRYDKTIIIKKKLNFKQKLNTNLDNYANAYATQILWRRRCFLYFHK